MGAILSTGIMDANNEEIIVQRVAIVNLDGSPSNSRTNYFNGAVASVGVDIPFTDVSAFNKMWQVPSGREMTPLQICMEVTTGALVGTRTIVITYETTSGIILGEFKASSTQIVNLSAVRYTFAESLANKITPIALTAGLRIRVKLENGQTGDSIASPRLIVKERILS